MKNFFPSAIPPPHLATVASSLLAVLDEFLDFGKIIFLPFPYKVLALTALMGRN
jgi:hypothetical protein